MLKTLKDILSLIEEYTKYLESRGCNFDEMGFPVLSRDFYLEEIPDDVVPYANRTLKFVNNPGKTLLCFYCPDRLIYPRLERIFDDLTEYRRFMGIAGFDVTVTLDMDIEWQKEIMLLNQLATAVVAYNGVPIVQNTRSGVQETHSCFRSVPKGVLCASGTLGCKNQDEFQTLDYIEKILTLQPSGVLLYGKQDKIMENQLSSMGIPFGRYKDIHSRYSNARRLQKPD